MPLGWIMPTRADREVAVDKDTEMTSAFDSLTVTLLESTSNLAENLLQSEPFLRYKAAGERLSADREAQHLMKEFSELQQKIRAEQSSGKLSENDIRHLREMQNAIGINDTIQDYLLTQELAVSLLREVNQEISQLLGIDFASLARRSGGCC